MEAIVNINQNTQAKNLRDENGHDALFKDTVSHGRKNNKSRVSNSDNEYRDKLKDSIRKYLASSQKDLKVEIHKETNTPIFKIIRRQDNKVIQEIPPSELLEIKVRLKSEIGAFLNITA